MPNLFDGRDDFAVVVDVLETVQLNRSDGVASAIATQGWRFSEKEVFFAAGATEICIDETNWHLPYVSDNAAPVVGDSIIDSYGLRSDVYEVERLRGSTRYAIVTRRPRLRSAHLERFDILQPSLERRPFGVAFRGWSLSRAGQLGVVSQARDDSSLPSDALLALVVTSAVVWPGDCVLGDRSGLFTVLEVSRPYGVRDLLSLVVARTSAD